MRQDKFYKANGSVGTSVLFWAIDGAGYTSNIDHAEIYFRAEMQRDVDNNWLRGNDEFPLSVKHVDQLTEWRVDHQYLNREYPEFVDPNDEYVIYRKNKWDGNDVAFAAILSHSFDYESARVFSENELQVIDLNNWVVIPKSHADEVARRTFQKFSINRRTMISGAGVIGLRKKRYRPTTGKTRTNCVVCGKLVWDYIHPDMQVTCDSDKCENKYIHHHY